MAEYKEEVNVIELTTGKKVFYNKILNETATQLEVEVVSKAGRIGRVVVEKALIAQRSLWEAVS